MLQSIPSFIPSILIVTCSNCVFVILGGFLSLEIKCKFHSEGGIYFVLELTAIFVKTSYYRVNSIFRSRILVAGSQQMYFSVGIYLITFLAFCLLREINHILQRACSSPPTIR